MLLAHAAVGATLVDAEGSRCVTERRNKGRVAVSRLVKNRKQDASLLGGGSEVKLMRQC
jgi:hypothetical protein